jgi:hypothetical protein
VLHIIVNLTIWIYATFIHCNIVPYSYFPHVLLLHMLYIQLQTLKCINSIINCNIVPYPYFPHVLSLHILYIQLQTVKYINWIINCNIFPYLYSPSVLLIPVTTWLNPFRCLRATNTFLRGCMLASPALNHRYLSTKLRINVTNFWIWFM